MKKALMTALLALSAGAFAAGTPAGTQIRNVAYLETLNSPDSSVPPTIIPSPPVTVTVVHVPAVDVDPNSPGTPTSPVVPTDPRNPAQCGQSVIAVPGQNAVLTYHVKNPSNGPDTYNLTTEAVAGTAAGAVTYYRDNGDGVFDAAVDPQVTALTLAADETATIFATYPVAASAVSTDAYSFTPVATSTTDGTVTDLNNYGCITVQATYAVTIVPSNTGNSESPGTVSYNHTLTNTGNSPLNTANTTLTTSNDLGWPTTYQIGNGPAFTSLQEALQNFGPLAPGQAVTVTVTIQTPAGLAGGTVDTVTISANTNPAAGPGVINGTPAPVLVTDVTTVLAGISSITKTVATCGQDTSCAAPVAVSGDLVRPGEVIQYTVTASNTGSGALRGARVRDPLPAELTPLSYKVTLAGLPAGGQVLYSADGQNWSADAGTLTQLAGGTVWVAYDSDADGAITYADLMPAGASVTTLITARVK